jgi:hypothetical protein
MLETILETLEHKMGQGLSMEVMILKDKVTMMTIKAPVQV